MIVRLRGQLIEKTPASVVVDVQGVGYGVTIPLATYDTLPALGDETTLYIYHHIREDGQTLFGFGSVKEREMFVRLIGVSGIGPKLAINVLSGLTPGELATAIVEGDVKRISSVNGLGKKTAERMIIELKDKINPLEALSMKGTGEPAPPILKDTMLSLTALGYSPDAARKMAQAAFEANPKASVSELLKLALKQ